MGGWDFDEYILRRILDVITGLVPVIHAWGRWIARTNRAMTKDL